VRVLIRFWYADISLFYKVLRKTGIIIFTIELFKNEL
jgi:hypothetical protein